MVNLQEPCLEINIDTNTVDNTNYLYQAIRDVSKAFKNASKMYEEEALMCRDVLLFIREKENKLDPIVYKNFQQLVNKAKRSLQVAKNIKSVEIDFCYGLEQDAKDIQLTSGITPVCPKELQDVLRLNQYCFLHHTTFCRCLPIRLQ